MYKLIGAFLVLASSFFPLWAQETGSFTKQIDFNNEKRNLSIFVPSTYNVAMPCKLVIGLHGAGDNSNNYRNWLVKNLGFETAFFNTILVCPDGGNDYARGFHIPAGDEAIIEESLQFIRNAYAIDTTQIILQGFSLGGYSALRYGLVNPLRFKALLLNTPAIQGVKEANNKSETVVLPYDKAGKLPIFVTIGDEDLNYLPPVDSAMVKLMEENALLNYQIFKGGHTVPKFTNYDYLSFFDHPYSSGPDVRVGKVDLPGRACVTNLAASVLMQNKGIDTVKSLKLSYTSGTSVKRQEWQGLLAAGAHTYIRLNDYDFGMDGNYTFSVTVDSVNHKADASLGDNTKGYDIQILSAKAGMPYAEHFDNINFGGNWAVNFSGDYIMPFDYDPGSKALTTFNSIFVFDNGGTREEVLTPNFNLSADQNAFLQFNTDYNFVQYTAAVFGKDTVFADTLEVLASLDCGVTYTSIFKKGGSELSGHEEPILDPLNMQAVYLDADPSKYLNHTIDVSAFTGNPDVHFKFSYISALGGYIYLTDVLLNSSPLSIEKLAVTEAEIYPNPARDFVQIVCKDNNKVDWVTVYDNMGRRILEERGTGNTSIRLNTQDLITGIYWLKINTRAGLLTKKIQVLR